MTQKEGPQRRLLRASQPRLSVGVLVVDAGHDAERGNRVEGADGTEEVALFARRRGGQRRRGRRSRSADDTHTSQDEEESSQEEVREVGNENERQERRRIAVADVAGSCKTERNVN